MTRRKNRISCVRILVEVDVAKDLVSEVAIKMPYGSRRIQQVVYENVPKFCSICKVLGHSLDGYHKNTQVKVNQKEKMADGVKDKNKGPIQANALTEEQERATKQSTMATDGSTPGSLRPLKHREVYRFLKTNNISVFALLETKLEEGRLSDIIRWKFIDWEPRLVVLEILHVSPHTVITWKISAKKFYVSFVYGLHSIVERRPLWQSLVQFGLRLRQPWLVMGDFNRALNTNDRRGASTVSSYEVRDFMECYVDLGLLDINYTSSHFTWTNNITWSKIDHAMCNNDWFTHELNATAKIVNENWSMFVHWTKEYILCRKLKLLKKGLKELNRRHFAHISVKVEDARAVLKRAQIELPDRALDDNLEAEKSIREWAGLCRRSMATIQNCLLRLKWDCRGTSWICNFRKLSFAGTLYYIWECGNKVVFEQYSPDRNHIISKIKIQELQHVIFGIAVGIPAYQKKKRKDQAIPRSRHNEEEKFKPLKTLKTYVLVRDMLNSFGNIVPYSFHSFIVIKGLWKIVWVIL
ncbi:hypothetical protein M9H77_11666 [Catharanthus roseus]|uniref:Uncharacterized protein n=1 Tax=Catharanthus roseus TaxID=4058 RepID=A0ACC0BF80_CATRO|nr:hypothetical protein M9H77_11666 [Catharanthus roseus]